MIVATEVRATATTERRRWTCRHCGRLLAFVVGRLFETPSATIRGNLPAVIVCPHCKTRNVKVD